MLELKDLWFVRKTARGYSNCAAFITMLHSIPKEVAELALHPNQKKAPWHVQFRFTNKRIVNVWPHKLTFQVGEQSVCHDDITWSKLERTLREVASDYYNDSREEVPE